MMSIPQPANNDKFQFIPRNHQVEPSNKVVELKRQKQESMAYHVTCLLAAEAISSWLKPKQYPLSRQQVLKLLGIGLATKELHEDDEGELKLIKFLEKQKTKKYKSLAKYGEQINLLNYVKKADSYRVGSFQDELRLRLEKLYTDYPVEIEDKEQVTEFFDFIEDYLKRWYFTPSRKAGFTSISLALKDNSVILQNRLYTRLEDIIWYGQESSLSGSVDFLKELSEDFQETEQRYTEEKEKYIEKENGSLRTYKRHLSVLKGEERDTLKSEENFKIAKNALLNIYKWKIEAESYSWATQIIKKIESSNQLYIGVFKDSNTFLSKLKADFLAETKESEVMLAFSLEPGSIDPENLLKKVEKKVGHTHSSWGRYRGVTPGMVRMAILSELKPIAEKICSNTYSHLEREYNSNI